MYFFCKEVKVENHEYHYHCTRNPNTKTSKHQKKKLIPRIETMATNTPQTIQSRSSSFNINKQSTTLLQRLRKKTESLVESSQSATQIKKMEKTCEKIIVLDQSVPQRMRNTGSCSGSSNSSVIVRGNVDFRSFSFGVNKEIMESETFNEQVQQSQNYVIQQESELVEHSISGKFTQIFCHISTQLYNETLSIDTTLPFAVTIKTFTCPQPDKHLHKQLQLYNKIGHHQNILDIYQVCFDNGKPIIIKQPYEKVKPSSSIDKELIKIDIGGLLVYLEEIGVRVGRLMVGHLRGCFGVWKLGDFGALVGGERVTVEENMEQLLNQIK